MMMTMIRGSGRPGQGGQLTPYNLELRSEIAYDAHK